MLIKAENRTVLTFKNGTVNFDEPPYYFIHAADPQLGFIHMMKGPTDDGPPPGEEWSEEIDLTRRCVDLINRMSPKPKFLLINGDLVNAMPDVAEIKRKQTQDLKTELSKIDDDIPILVTSGNHDIGNETSQQFIEEYKSDFGDDYYSFSVKGVKYIALNSQTLFEQSQAVKQHRECQLKWLDEELRKLKSAGFKRCIVFMHIPMFIESADEKDQYFNIPTELRWDLLRRFHAANVEAIFCGHYHRCAGAKWTPKDGGKGIEVVVSSAIGAQLGTEKSGFTIVKVDEKEILHKYLSFEEMPADLNSINF